MRSLALAAAIVSVAACRPTEPPANPKAAPSSRPSTFRATLVRVPVVKAVVGGIAVDAVIDTGAARSAVDETFVRRLGWAVSCEGDRCSSPLPKLSLASNDVAAIVADVVSTEARFPERPTLVLGVDVLSKLVVTFDYPAGRVGFATSLPPGGTRVPLSLRDGRPWLDLSLEGAPARARLDTGVEETLVVRAPRPLRVAGGPLSVRAPAWARELSFRSASATVGLAGAKVEALAVLVAEAAPPAVDEDVLLGASLLRDRRVSLSLADRVLVLDP